MCIWWIWNCDWFFVWDKNIKNSTWAWIGLVCFPGAAVLKSGSHRHTVAGASTLLAQYLFCIPSTLDLSTTAGFTQCVFHSTPWMWLNSKITCRCGAIVSSTSLSSNVVFGLCLSCLFYQWYLAHLKSGKNNLCKLQKLCRIAVSRILFKLHKQIFVDYMNRLVLELARGEGRG